MTFKYKIKHGRPSILQVRKKYLFYVVELFVELAVKRNVELTFQNKSRK